LGEIEGKLGLDCLMEILKREGIFVFIFIFILGGYEILFFPLCFAYLLFLSEEKTETNTVTLVSIVDQINPCALVLVNLS
jgi:hypothetical protein